MSHPSASLYQQEYLAANGSFPNYKSMITLDFLIGESTIESVISTKIRDLRNLKMTNPIVDYNIISNDATGETIIDCMIGTNATSKQDNLVERDVYRYKAIKTKSGKRGILLSNISIRKYGADIDPFLIRLKTDKSLLIKEVAKLSLPAIQL